jgi:hypothetical protein
LSGENKKMLVILEGADGSGKSSLATRIRKDIDEYLLFLKSNGPPHTLGQLANVLGVLTNLRDQSIPVVTDRNPVISEYVYGPIIRGKCMHALSIEQMARWFKDTMIIHCRPNYQALAAGVRKEVQMEGVVLNHRHIIQAYDDLMGFLEKEGVYIKRYDYTGPPQLVLDSIKAFIRKGTPQ